MQSKQWNISLLTSEETVSNKQREILERIKQVKKGFYDLQKTDYQTLLNCRRDVFLHIYKEISIEKDFILDL